MLAALVSDSGSLRVCASTTSDRPDLDRKIGLFQIAKGTFILTKYSIDAHIYIHTYKHLIL
jgi:hypothetical protein